MKEQIALDEQNRYLRQDGTVGALTTDGSSPKHNNRIVESKVYPCLTPGRKEKRQNGPRFREEGGEEFTLTGQDIHGVGIEETPNFRIRKLTPKECWRLMGFSDEDFAKAKQVNSDSQLYKQAGNSIVVDVLMAIFGEML